MPTYPRRGEPPNPRRRRGGRGERFPRDRVRQRQEPSGGHARAGRVARSDASEPTGPAGPNRGARRDVVRRHLVRRRCGHRKRRRQPTRGVDQPRLAHLAERRDRGARVLRPAGHPPLGGLPGRAHGRGGVEVRRRARKSPHRLLVPATRRHARGRARRLDPVRRRRRRQCQPDRGRAGRLADRRQPTQWCRRLGIRRRHRLPARRRRPGAVLGRGSPHRRARPGARRRGLDGGG
jgi:hypothetical protein